MRNGHPFKPVGRPPLTRELRDVVIRIGSENLLWGYKRIAGELKKLGLYAGAYSVKRILNEAGIHPSPEKRKKKPALPWAIFVRAHMESMVACDFFIKTVLTARRPLTAYVLIFIHLGSRRVYCSAPTYAPDAAWVTQQVRNTVMWCAKQGIEPSFLIRDADTKFSASFDTVWASEGSRVIQIPHREPDANAFAESFIGTIKCECLDFFVCFSRSQRDYILQTWVRHYNTERPPLERSIGNNVLQVDFRPARDGPIRHNRQLGGIVTPTHATRRECPLAASLFSQWASPCQLPQEPRFMGATQSKALFSLSLEKAAMGLQDASQLGGWCWMIPKSA